MDEKNVTITYISIVINLIAVLYFSSRLTMKVNMAKTPLSIYLDLSKAFNIIKHDILSKLDHYSITGVANSLFKS